MRFSLRIFLGYFLLVGMLSAYVISVVRDEIKPAMRRSAEAVLLDSANLLAELVQPKPSATHVFFKSHDGYSTNNPLDVCLDDDVLIAHSWNGAPLSVEHGGPARVIVPKRYAWKGAKWIREITFLDRDILGFWEVRGYSNTADPWTEDRFS